MALHAVAHPAPQGRNTRLLGLLPLFVLAHFAHHLLTALPVPLLPMIRSGFHLSYTESGLLVSAFSLTYGLAQLPAGWLADRIGRRFLVTISICGVAVTGVVVGLSQTYLLLVAGFILMGVLGGGYHPGAPPLVSAAVAPAHLGRALGFHAIGGSASFFLAPLVGVAVATAWGWRGAFLSLAAPTFVFGAIFHVLLGRIQSPSLGGTAETGRGLPARAARMRLRPLLAVMALITGATAVTTAVIAFVPLFLVDRFSVSQRTAAVFLSIIYAASFFAAPAAGYMADRLGKIPLILASCLATGPVILLFDRLPFGWGTGALFLIFGALIMGSGPVVEAFIMSQTNEANRSTVMGVFYFVNMESGAVLTPLMGRLIDTRGFPFSFALGGIFLVVLTLVCGMALWKEKG